MTKNLQLNQISKRGEQYYVTLKSGEEYPCVRWYEKKCDTWHVKLPKEAQAQCGRTYIREKLLVDGKYTFEDKLEHREGLQSGGWRTKLTDEERLELEKAEQTIERLKQIAKTREIPKLEKGTPEYILKQIEDLKKKLERMKGGEA